LAVLSIFLSIIFLFIILVISKSKIRFLEEKIEEEKENKVEYIKK